MLWIHLFFFFSSRRRHTRFSRDWSSDVCSSDLKQYDLEAFNEFYDKYSQSVVAEKIDGTSLSTLYGLTLNFKSIAKLYAEVVTSLVLKNGIVTVGNGPIQTKHDALNGGSFTSDIGSIHNHNFDGGDVIWANKGVRQWNIKSGPSGSRGSISSTGDIGQLGNSIYRSVMVSPTKIYLYNKANTIAIPR